MSDEAVCRTAPATTGLLTNRSNLSKMYTNKLFFQLQCNQDNPEIDTQKHLFNCAKLKILNINDVKIQDVFNLKATEG